MNQSGDEREFVDQRESLPDDELLYRRIHPSWVDWNNTVDGTPRIMRAAFQDYKEATARERGYPGPCLSVGLRRVMVEHGRRPIDLLDGWNTERSRYGIAALQAKDVREQNQGLMHWPTEREPWHGVVFSKTGKKRTGSGESALARAASLIHLPSRPE